ncbi:MAG: methyltransferase domain-containing protein [Armatimonadota bacterium]
MRTHSWRLVICLALMAVVAGAVFGGRPGGPPGSAGDRGGAPAAPAAQNDGYGRGVEPLRVAVMPFSPRHLGEELVGAWIASSGVAATVTLFQGYPPLEQAVKAGRIDVVLGSCPDSTKKAADAGLIIPESDTTLYYGRLAMFLPPTDPLKIMSAQDLDRPGLRLGLHTGQLSGPLEEKLKAKGAVVGDSMEALLDRLQRGELDVVVGMDLAGRLRPDLVTIRLPRSAAGDDAAKAGHGYAVRGTKRLADAQALLQFCVKSREASGLMLSRAILDSDGGRAADYKEGAGKRMMPSYISVAKTVAADYATGAANCLDLGCGPGQLTVEVAKASGLEVTGLDIEPEAIEFAVQYGKECGLDSRMHWVAADVHALPFPDNSFNVVMSRGSIFFWRDQATALREIMRVLKPGGWAYLGGGSGRFLSKEDAEKTQQPIPRDFNFPFPLDNVPALMARAGIADYRHLTEGGNWIEFRKPAAPAQAG